jgi:F0F1-type ATP synthase membrane subunit b/b'
MIVIIRQGFGIKTDLFETNILNLRVVLGIVVTFVGDALLTLLDQRKQIILLTLNEVDQKAKEVQQQLEDAREAVETARSRAQEIRNQAIQTVEQENVRIQQMLKDDLYRIQEIGKQRVKLERQRIIQLVAQQVAQMTLKIAEGRLLITFNSQGRSRSKQKELNDIHVRETFRQLKRSLHNIIRRTFLIHKTS